MSFISSLLNKLTGKTDSNLCVDTTNQAIACAYMEITTVAAPGLMTLLDTALFKTYEGQLTATVSSANATLHAFLELKSQAKLLLQACISSSNMTCNCTKKVQTEADADVDVGDVVANIHTLESFARHCIDCSNEAITRLTTDKLASTANLPPDNQGHGNSNSTINYNSTIDIPTAIRSSMDDTFSEVGMRLRPEHQHQWLKRDCWESKQLHCVDYVWGDNAVLQCQRLVRAMIKYDAVESLMTMALMIHQNYKSKSNVEVKLLTKRFENMMILLRHDLPMRLQQFRQGIESDIVVSKRLYLIKNEYRAPFRSFLEGHMHVQRAPSLDLVMEYIQLHDDGNGNSNGNSNSGETLKKRRKAANQKIQDCLRNEGFVKAIRLEEQCEGLEVSMANVLLPFCELARLLLDGRQVVRLVEVPGVLEGEEEVMRLQELLRRLKGILCRKTGASSAGTGSGRERDRESSIGIRPLLLDVQGIPRDPSGEASMEFDPFRISGGGDVVGTTARTSREGMKQRLDVLCSQLQCIYEVGKVSRFGVEKKEMETLPAAIGACANANFHAEKFSKAYTEWYDFSVQQRELAQGAKGEPSLNELSQDIRKAEIEVSIAMASSQALSMVRQRIELIEKDRLKRFEILKEMVEECCLREMDIRLNLVVPDKDCILELPEIRSAPGLFHPALEMAGE